MIGIPRFALPAENGNYISGPVAYLQTDYGGVTEHHGALLAERALEFMTPATVSTYFLADALRLLRIMHGGRDVTAAGERVRDFLARAEAAYLALPKPEQEGRSASPGAAASLSSGERLEALASTTHQTLEGVTMSTRKKTVQKAAQPRSAKKKSATKKAAKKPSRKKAT